MGSIHPLWHLKLLRSIYLDNHSVLIALSVKQGDFSIQLSFNGRADFVACDLAIQGVPSREALEVALGASTALSSVLWVRCANPHHPDTPPEAVGIVVASNWAAFTPGDSVDWEAVTQAVGPL